MRISVKYVTMVVKSLAESEAFYENVLGFAKGYHIAFPVGGLTVMDSPDGARVELIEAPQLPIGLYSVGTDVDDLEETIKHIKECGGTILGESTPTPVGPHIFALDPNGVQICLIQHNEDYKKKYWGK